MRISMAAVLAATWLFTTASPADAGWRRRPSPTRTCTNCAPSSHGTSTCTSGNCGSIERPREVNFEPISQSPSEIKVALETAKGNWTPIPAGKPEKLGYASIDQTVLENLLLDPGTDAVDVRVPSSANPRGVFTRALINADGKACVMEGSACKELDPEEAMQARTIEELKKWVLAQDELAEKEPFATFVGRKEKPVREEQKEVAEAPAAKGNESVAAPPVTLSEELAKAAKDMHSMNRKAAVAEHALSQIANPTSPAAAIASSLLPKSALLRPVANFFKPTVEAVKTEAAAQAKELEAGAEQVEAYEEIEKMRQREREQLPTRAREKTAGLLAALEKGKPGDLESALERILTDDELYTEEERNAVFGEDYDAIGDKKSVAVAYTEARKQLRADLLDAVSRELQKSVDPRAKALAKAVEATKVANANAYDVASDRIRHDPTQDTPICFTCGEHYTTEYSFFDEMEKAAKAALAQNGFSAGDQKTAWFNGDFGRASTGEALLVNIGLNGQIFARKTTQIGTERDPLSDDAGLNEAVKKYYREQVARMHSENGGQWPSNWTEPQRQAVAKLLGTEPPPAQVAVARQPAQQGPRPVSAQPSQQPQQRIAQVNQPSRTSSQALPTQPLSAQLVVVGNLIGGCTRCVDFERALKTTAVPAGLSFQNMDQNQAGSLRSGQWPILYLVKNGQYIRLAEGNGPLNLLRTGRLAEIVRQRQ